MRIRLTSCLAAIGMGTMALSGCSGQAGAGNNAASPRNAAQGNAAAPMPATFPAGQDAGDFAQALCIEAARQRFGINPDDVTSMSFGGGGETPRQTEGGVTLGLGGPPPRQFECEVAGGAVTSLRETSGQQGPGGQANII